MNYTLDIRIFGVTKRMDNIQYNQKFLGLPDSQIFLDKTYEGCVPTARRAYCYPTDATHILVLQDDIGLCNGFLDICHRMIEAQPDAIISLFPWQFRKHKSIKLRSIRELESPYVSTTDVSGCGVIMPTKYAKPCWDSIPEDALCDDTSINAWAKDNGISVITTLPAILQHIGNISVMDITRILRYTVFFDRDPQWADWDNTKVITVGRYCS